MNQERLMKVLVAPVISEKSTLATDANNQYVFKVAVDASKPEIKHAVELMFSVEVDAVRVANVNGKTKRFGARLGRRNDWKKAYVTLKADHQIDFMGRAE
jgi:large subunit ribosomal protein L23